MVVVLTVEDGTGGDCVDNLDGSTPLEGKVMGTEEVVAGVRECEVVADTTDCTLICPSVVIPLPPDGNPADVVAAATVGCA